MRGRTPKRLVAGMRAMLQVGSPVRQWMYTLDPKPKAWLTPTRYVPASRDGVGSDGEPEYVDVEVTQVTPPYAIVYHYDGEGWVRLWLDMREVRLYAVSK
jgi:hypothetical protein